MATLLTMTSCSTTIRNTWSFEQMPKASVRETFTVRGLGLCAANGYFVLVRRADDAVAIRFTDVRTGSEEGTGAARYEAFFVRRGMPFSSPERVRREGILTIEGWTGFHPLSRQIGRHRVKLESIGIAYGGGSCISFEPGYEYAPTPWASIVDVDRSAHLKWYRYDRLSEMLLELEPREVLGSSELESQLRSSISRNTPRSR
jgi:hypothetical protein